MIFESGRQNVNEILSQLTMLINNNSQLICVTGGRTKKTHIDQPPQWNILDFRFWIFYEIESDWIVTINFETLYICEGAKKWSRYN